MALQPIARIETKSYEPTKIAKNTGSDHDPSRMIIDNPLNEINASRRWCLALMPIMPVRRAREGNRAIFHGASALIDLTNDMQSS